MLDEEVVEVVSAEAAPEVGEVVQVAGQRRSQATAVEELRRSRTVVDQSLLPRRKNIVAARRKALLETTRRRS